MKRLNVLASIALAMLPLSTMGQSAMAKGLPKYNPNQFPIKNVIVQVYGVNRSIPIIDYKGQKYVNLSVLNDINNRGTFTIVWRKAHGIMLFSNMPMYITLSLLKKTVYHPFHPIMNGPNLAPPLPKGVTMAQWKAAVVQAKEVTSPLLSVSEAMALSKEYSPLSTKTQWFNDPSDPFFNKRFPVKDLKDGFVISHKPLVIVGRPKGYDQILVMQYVGGGPQGTLWMAEDITPNGMVHDVVPNVSSDWNGGYSYMRPYKNLGITVNAITAQNLTWLAGDGLNVVPLPHWNPSWILQPIGSSA